jgi:hypothetical protein
MGHPRMVSMADAAETADIRILTNAVEQLAYEQRTANLIAILTARDVSGQSAFSTEQMGAAIEEIETRLGLSSTPESTTEEVRRGG